MEYKEQNTGGRPYPTTRYAVPAPPKSVTKNLLQHLLVLYLLYMVNSSSPKLLTVFLNTKHWYFLKTFWNLAELVTRPEHTKGAKDEVKS